MEAGRNEDARMENGHSEDGHSEDGHREDGRSEDGYGDGPSFVVRAIGVVSSPRTEVADDDWGDVVSTIALLPPFGAEALEGLATFSHLDVVYLFDRVDPGHVCTGRRRPRGNPDWPEVGIFAQRGKDRPNRLGVSTCELVGVDGTTVTVRGLDAVDGTPVLDLKPHLAEFDPRREVAQPAWSHELMTRYW
jgi:tRNA-Thr(GGU) m(6)t(6)A37 methyltransferase TsaA